MKRGDLVLLKNLDESWGMLGLITKIYKTACGTGQIHLIAGGEMMCTIPWNSRDMYMEEIEDESR